MKRFAIIDGKRVCSTAATMPCQISARAMGRRRAGVWVCGAVARTHQEAQTRLRVCVAWDKPHTNIRRRKALSSGVQGWSQSPRRRIFTCKYRCCMSCLKHFRGRCMRLTTMRPMTSSCTLAEKAAAVGIETCLITSDLDALQCVGPLTHVYALKKALVTSSCFTLRVLPENTACVSTNS